MPDKPWFDPNLSSQERGRAYRRGKGEFVHVDEMDREVSVHVSRFHGPIITVHGRAGCAYLGEGGALALARFLLAGTRYEVKEAEPDV